MPLDHPQIPPSPTVPVHLPRMRYPTSLTPGRPPHASHNHPPNHDSGTPLHRRGTSSKYESLEELLREHGYKDVRVITPLAERLASGAKYTTAPPAPPDPPLRAVDLLRSLASAYAAPSSRTSTTLSTPSLPSAPSPSPSPSPSPRVPTPQPRPQPLAFLSTDPYSHPRPVTPSKAPPKLVHTRSTPQLPRRPLTPVTNQPRGPPARPLLTPTRVQCHSHTHAPLPRRRLSHTPPLPVLAPSPPLSPNTPAPLRSGVRAEKPRPPSRARSIRSLRAHLSRPTTPTPTPTAKSRSRDRLKKKGERERAESPEPDFSDLGMLRDPRWGGEGEGEDDDEGEGWERRVQNSRGRRMGLPWVWR